MRDKVRIVFTGGKMTKAQRELLCELWKRIADQPDPALHWIWFQLYRNVCKQIEGASNETSSEF